MGMARTTRWMGIAGAAILSCALAGAQGPGMGMMGPTLGGHRPHAFGTAGPQRQWWNNPNVVERLKLTDDQRKQMDEILYQHREKLIDLQANLERAEVGMQPLMSADQPNEAAIDAQIDKVVQARAELERANARFLLALRMKLTPDQWKQVQEFRASHMERRDMQERGPGMHRQWRQRPDGGQGNPPPPDGQQGQPPAAPPPGTGGNTPQ